MAGSNRIYYVDIKFPPVALPSSLQSTLPGDFDNGEHATVRMHLDESFWIVKQNDPTSSRLLTRYFGGPKGGLRGGGGNWSMYVDNDLVGVFCLATSKETEIEGTIGTKYKTGPHLIPFTGVEIYTHGCYYRRRIVWSDRSAEERFSIIFKAAQKNSDAEVAELLSGLLKALPMVIGVTSALIYLGAGTPIGQGVGLILGLVLGGIAITTRGQEYWNELQIVNEYWNSSGGDPNQSDIDRAGKALSNFFKMVLEDCAFALVAAVTAKVAANKMSSKNNSGKTKAAETIDEAWKRGDSQEKIRKLYREDSKWYAERAKKAGGDYFAEYSVPELKCAQDHAFRSMPKFRKGKSADLRKWLIDNKFIFHKKSIMQEGKNANAGGSEIWIRKAGGSMGEHGLAEVVRIDVAGHDAKVFPNEGVMRRGPDGKVKAQAWGGLRHFHKDVVPYAKLQTYCKEFVPGIRSISDYGNLIDPKGNNGTNGKMLWANIHIELTD
jgi:hypothetical protein